MKSQVLILALIWGLVALIGSLANAFVAYETAQGIVEVRSLNDWGLNVTRVQKRKSANGKRWIYFCVNEITAKNIKTPAEKCFYGNPKTFSNVRVGARFRSIEYGLRNRVYNNKGFIAIGSERYFYPVYVLYGMK